MFFSYSLCSGQTSLQPGKVWSLQKSQLKHIASPTDYHPQGQRSSRGPQPWPSQPAHRVRRRQGISRAFIVLCTVQPFSAGTGRALGSFVSLSAVLVVPRSHNRHLLSSSSLIKRDPFRRPAHTIALAASPLQQMWSFPLLQPAAGTRCNTPPLQLSRPQNPTPESFSPCRRLQGRLWCCFSPRLLGVQHPPEQAFPLHQAKTTKNSF